jgi:tetratricopeptide (TPR) repeat protein
MTRDALRNAEASGDQPLLGQRYAILAWIRLWRGDLDDATDALRRSDEILADKPEPQGEIPRAGIAGELALARGRDDEALEHFRRGVNLASNYNVDQDPQVELGLIRILASRGDREEAGHARAILDRGRSPFARACAEVADGLLAEDPLEAVRSLRAASEHLEALGTRVDLGRAFLDLGRAMRRAGEDPSGIFTRAREDLIGCDAQLFVREADEELAR